jgi:hypothetical protein
MNDDYVRERIAPNAAGKVREDAGMFIVRYNPQNSLAGTTPSCQYNVGVNEKDNIASALRKNTKDIQSMMDDWFGVDEDDKSQRIFISHQEKIDDTNAYCTVTYAGYESENEGEVSATLSDQISSVIDTKIRMNWNDTAYPVTDVHVESERSKEESRAKLDNQFVSESKSATVEHDTNVQLNSSLCNESCYNDEKTKDNGYNL